jgi:hypothetical protein
MWLFAGLAQGEVFHRNLASGGRKGSWLATLGIGLAGRLVAAGLLLLFVLLLRRFY